MRSMTSTTRSPAFIRSTALPAGALALVLVASSCAVRIGADDGPLVTETYDIGDFDELTVDGVWDVIVTSGSETTLEIEVAEDLLNDVEITEDGDRLSISMEDAGWFRSHRGRRTARITTPGFLELRASGATDIDVDDLSAERFDIDIDGASSLDLDALDVDELHIDLSGASSVSGDGTVGLLELSVEGSSEVEFSRMAIDEVEVTASGASSLDLESAESVSGTLSGASSLDVSDSASVNVRTSGVSSVD